MKDIVAAAEVQGKTFAELNYPADVAARLDRHTGTVFKTGEIIEDEVLYTNEAGSKVYLSYTLSTGNR